MAHVRMRFHLRPNILVGCSLFIAVNLLLWQPIVTAQGRGGVLRIGMTASDIPNA